MLWFWAQTLKPVTGSSVVHLPEVLSLLWFLSDLFLPFCSQTKQVWSVLYFWPSTWLKITHFYHARNDYHNIFRSGFVFSSSLHSQWKKKIAFYDCCIRGEFFFSWLLCENLLLKLILLSLTKQFFQTTLLLN